MAPRVAIAARPAGDRRHDRRVGGEVDGRGTFSWTSLKPNYKEWVESGDYKILFQMGLRKHPDMPNVPLVQDLTNDEELKKVLKVQFTAFEVGRPLFVAEGVPDFKLFTAYPGVFYSPDDHIYRAMQQTAKKAARNLPRPALPTEATPSRR